MPIRIVSHIASNRSLLAGSILASLVKVNVANHITILVRLGKLDDVLTLICNLPCAKFTWHDKLTLNGCHHRWIQLSVNHLHGTVNLHGLLGIQPCRFVLCSVTIQVIIFLLLITRRRESILIEILNLLVKLGILGLLLFHFLLHLLGVLFKEFLCSNQLVFFGKRLALSLIQLLDVCLILGNLSLLSGDRLLKAFSTHYIIYNVVDGILQVALSYLLVLDAQLIARVGHGARYAAQVIENLRMCDKIITVNVNGKVHVYQPLWRILVTYLFLILNHLLVVVLEVIFHVGNAGKAMLSNAYLLELTIRERLLDSVKASLLSVGKCLNLLDTLLQQRLSAVYVNLVKLPLLLATFQSAQLSFCLVLLQGILATRQLGYGITEDVTLLFKHTVTHAVGNHILAVHDAVSNGSLGLQTLVSSNIKAIFHTHAKHTYRDAPFLQQVTLSDNTSIALRIVHRAVRCVHMDEGM